MNIPEQVNIFNKILDVCLKSINNEERASAEIQRNTFFEQTSNFLQIFQILIDNENISKSKKKYLIQLLKKKANHITNLSKNNSTLIYKICLEKIFDKNIPDDEKLMYRDCLKSLFTPFAPSNPNTIIELRDDLILELMKKVNSNLERYEIISILHCFSAILEPKKLFNPTQIFKTIFPKIDTLQIKFVFPILNHFESSRFNLKKLDANLKEECIKNLEILEIFMNLIRTFIQNFRISRLKNKIIEMSSNENMISFLHNVLFFEIGNLSKNKNNTIFDPTLIHEFNQKINNIKFHTLETLLILFKLYNDKKDKIEKISYFFNTIINTLIKSLNNLYSAKDFNLSILSKVGKSPLIYLIETSTRFIYRATDKFIYHKNFFENINNLLKNYIFLNLLTSPEIIKNFQNEKEEINGLITDMISDNMGDNLIIITSKALKKICLKIDSSLFFCFNLSVEIIDFYLSDDQTKKNKKFSFLEQIKQTRFFLETDIINKIDVSLLILTILHKQIKKRTKFVKVLENIMSLYSEKLLSINDFISFRFLYVISCYIGHLFCDNNIYKEEGQIFFKIIFSFISKCQNLDHSSLKILENFTSDDDHKSFFFENFFFGIFNNVLEEVKFSNNDTVFSLIMQFVIEKKKVMFNESELFEKILLVLMNRLNFENEKDQREMNSTVIIHCWNILLELSNSQKLCKKYYSRFYFYLKHFLDKIIKNNKKNDFTEDFLNVMINVIKKSEIIVPYYNDLFLAIPEIQKKNQGHIKIVLKLILNIFYKFENILDDNKLAFLIKLSISPFLNEIPKNISSYNLKDFFILIHLTIQKFGNRIPLNYLIEYIKIYNKGGSILNEENDFLSNKFLKKNIDRIILSLFYIKPQYTFETLENSIDTVVESILNCYNTYETIYEKKLLICSLMNIFYHLYNFPKKNEKLILSITNFLFSFMKLNAISNICVYLRKKIDKNKKLKYFEREYINLEKEIKAFLNQNYVKSEIQDETNSDSYSYSNYDYDYNEGVLSLNEDSSLDNDEIEEFYKESPLFKSDEYIIFRNLFENIDKNDSFFISNLRDKLDEFVEKMVDDVFFRTKYFSFDNNLIIRIVKTYKRK